MKVIDDLEKIRKLAQNRYINNPVVVENIELSIEDINILLKQYNDISINHCNIVDDLSRPILFLSGHIEFNNCNFIVKNTLTLFTIQNAFVNLTFNDCNFTRSEEVVAYRADFNYIRISKVEGLSLDISESFVRHFTINRSKLKKICTYFSTIVYMSSLLSKDFEIEFKSTSVYVFSGLTQYTADSQCSRELVEKSIKTK